MIEWETQGELDLALLRQMEREALLETVYDERRLSDAEIQTLLKERCARWQKFAAFWTRTRRTRPALKKSSVSSRSMRQSAQTAAHGMIFKTSVKSAQRLKASARVFSRQDKRRA